MLLCMVIKLDISDLPIRDVHILTDVTGSLETHKQWDN